MSFLLNTRGFFTYKIIMLFCNFFFLKSLVFAKPSSFGFQVLRLIGLFFQSLEVIVEDIFP